MGVGLSVSDNAIPFSVVLVGDLSESIIEAVSWSINVEAFECVAVLVISTISPLLTSRSISDATGESIGSTVVISGIKTLFSSVEASLPNTLF